MTTKNLTTPEDTDFEMMTPGGTAYENAIDQLDLANCILSGITDLIIEAGKELRNEWIHALSAESIEYGFSRQGVLEEFEELRLHLWEQLKRARKLLIFNKMLNLGDDDLQESLREMVAEVATNLGEVTLEVNRFIKYWVRKRREEKTRLQRLSGMP
jgi:hypothetical protein